MGGWHLLMGGGRDIRSKTILDHRTIGHSYIYSSPYTIHVLGKGLHNSSYAYTFIDT